MFSRPALQSLPFFTLVLLYTLHDNQNGIPSDGNPYIFNGDIVDRGRYGIEVLTILLGFRKLRRSDGERDEREIVCAHRVMDPFIQAPFNPLGYFINPPFFSCCRAAVPILDVYSPRKPRRLSPQ